MCTHVDVLNQEKNIPVQQPLILKWYFYYLCYECYLFIFIEIIPIIMFILLSMPVMGCSRLVIGEGSHCSNPQSCSVGPGVTDIRGALSMRFVLYSMLFQLFSLYSLYYYLYREWRYIVMALTDFMIQRIEMELTIQ
jgi:hypothetical protein